MAEVKGDRQRLPQKLLETALAHSRTAAQELERSSELIALHAWVAANLEGTWVAVGKFRLCRGQRYIARRVFFDKSRRAVCMEPAVAVWTEHGWEELFGSLHKTTATSASIEVLMPPKPTRKGKA